MDKRGCTIALFIPIFIIVLMVILYIVSAAVNDFTATEVKNDIMALPLPQNTTVEESLSRAGNLTGNGNGMQFFGAVLLKSDMSLNELEAYYDPLRPDEWHYIVERQDGKEIKPTEHPVLSFKTDIDGDNYYILYSWGDGNNLFRNFDLRGH